MEELLVGAANTPSPTRDNSLPSLAPTTDHAIAPNTVPLRRAKADTPNIGWRGDPPPSPGAFDPTGSRDGEAGRARRAGHADRHVTIEAVSQNLLVLYSSTVSPGDTLITTISINTNIGKPHGDTTQIPEASGGASEVEGVICDRHSVSHAYIQT